MAGELDFRQVAIDDDDGAALVAAMIDEMRELYDGLDLLSPSMPKAGAAELGPPAAAVSNGCPTVPVRSNACTSCPRRGVTGSRGLYESEGCAPIGNFNGNPVATFFGEKRLTG